MAINPLIALQTQGIDTATPTRNLLGFAQQQQQNEQQQELLDMKKEALDREAESDRVESSLIGGATLNRLLEDENIEGAKNYLRTRGKNLIDNGINPDGTFGAMKMLEEDPERLQQITKWMEQEALSRGLIKSKSEGGFTLGDTRFDAMGNEIASVDDEDFSARNILLPDGTKVSGRTTEEGRIEVVGENGQFVPAPSGAQIISTALQGSESDIGATKPEIRDFRQLEAQMPVVNRLQERIREGLASGEYVGGISGGTLKGLNSLRNQAQQVFRQFNKDKSEDQQDVDLSVDKFRPALGEVANMNSQVQSAILSLAYMTLKSRDPGGRVSDNDIKLELDSFGVDTSDPSIIMERVNEKIGDLYTSYEATAKGLNMEPRFQFGESKVPDQTGNTGGSPEPAPQDDPLGIRQ